MTAPLWDSIPSAARILPHWVLWKAEIREGKPTKVPFDIHGGRASSTASHTWAAFDEVKKAFEAGGFSGIGFVFTQPAGIVGIDLDHCRDPSTGEVDVWAADITRRLSSYTEVSPSGAGLHVLVRGKLPDGAKGRKKGLNGPEYREGAAIEVYASGRFFTVTGRRVGDLPADIEERQAELNALFVEIFGPEQGHEQADGREAEQGSVHTTTTRGRSSLSDEEIVELASRSKNGSEFAALFSGSTAGYGGDDSAADMALMNMLAFWTGGDPLQMERIFSASGLGKRDKWRNRPDYRERTIQKAIASTTEVYRPGERNEAGHILEDLPERLRENPRAIKEPGVIEGLARLKKDDRIEYDIIIDGIKKSKTGIKIETIEKMVADADNGKAEQPPVPPLPEDITRAATRIAERGKPFKFMLRTFRQSHVGDELHAASQFISFGQQSAINTSGVFDSWEGPSGKGKSDAAKACARQLPEEFIITSSISPKSIYYKAKAGLMLPGSVLYLDDKNVQAGSDLEETLKRIQTFYQEGAEHETVDGAGNFLHTKLPPRLGIIRTTVDSSEADGQLKNRAIGHGVDSSRETDNAVCDLVLKLGAVGQNTNRVTRQTLICRALWRDIKSQAYRVVTPASDKIVEFSDTSNRRNPSLFLDMVRGLACINHRQRHQADGPDGERLLYANYDDYLTAAKLFNAQGDYLGSRLDDAERAAVRYIQSQGYVGATKAGILQHLTEIFPNDGWNDNRVRRLLDGRWDRGGGGLSDMVPGLSYRYDTTDTGTKTKVYFMTGEVTTGVRVIIHNPKEKNVSSEDLAHLAHPWPTVGHPLNHTQTHTHTQHMAQMAQKKKGGKNTTEECEPVKDVLPRLPGFFGPSGPGGSKIGPAHSEKAPGPEVARAGPGGPGGGPEPSQVDVQPRGGVDGQDVAREEHFKTKAEEVAGSGLPAGEPQKQTPPEEEPPGLQEFKAAIARRKCGKCGKTFPHDLAPWKADGDILSYICPECRVRAEVERGCEFCPAAHGDKTAARCWPCFYVEAASA